MNPFTECVWDKHQTVIPHHFRNRGQVMHHWPGRRRGCFLEVESDVWVQAHHLWPEHDIKLCIFAPYLRGCSGAADTRTTVYCGWGFIFSIVPAYPANTPSPQEPMRLKTRSMPLALCQVLWHIPEWNEGSVWSAVSYSSSYGHRSRRNYWFSIELCT